MIYNVDDKLWYKIMDNMKGSEVVSVCPSHG